MLECRAATKVRAPAPGYKEIGAKITRPDAGEKAIDTGKVPTYFLCRTLKA